MPFVKGQSGNPGGRPKQTTKDGRHISDIAKEHSEDAIRTLVEIAGNAQESSRSRVAAANSLLDRAWGRPSQQVDANVAGEVIAKLIYPGLDD